MESLASLLILDDIQRAKKSIIQEIFRIKKFRRQIKNFNSFLNKDFKIPISSKKFKNKLAHIDLITFQGDIFLCLNVTYARSGKPRLIDSATQTGTFKEITKVSSVRTLSGKRFKRIETKQFKNVKVVEIEKLFPVAKNIALIENANEHFASRKKIFDQWKWFTPA